MGQFSPPHGDFNGAGPLCLRQWQTLARPLLPSAHWGSLLLGLAPTLSRFFISSWPVLIIFSFAKWTLFVRVDLLSHWFRRRAENKMDDWTKGGGTSRQKGGLQHDLLSPARLDRAENQNPTRRIAQRSVNEWVKALIDWRCGGWMRVIWINSPQRCAWGEERENRKREQKDNTRREREREIWSHKTSEKYSKRKFKSEQFCQLLALWADCPDRWKKVYVDEFDSAVYIFMLQFLS